MDRPTVPCIWCGKPTMMTATKQCDNHWELSHRIQYEPEMAARMLKELQENNGSYITNPGTKGSNLEGSQS